MDRLSSCYFCGGALDASLSEYPVVPSELRSADDEGSTVVLCSTCRRKLGAVVEEVVAAARDDSAAETTTTARSTETEAPSTNGAGPDDADTSLFDDADDEPATADATDDEDASPAARDAETESTTEANAASDDQADEPTTGSSAAGGDTADEEPTLTKLEYNKVMRLLKNRPFPVDRGEIREVATSAYDIDPDEFDAVIDAAVERDLLAVENGQFVDPA